MIVAAGHLQRGDILRRRGGDHIGETCIVVEVRHAAHAALTMVFRYEDGAAERVSALAWDDFDLVAQPIDSEIDLDPERCYS